MSALNPEERVTSLEHQVDALTIAIQSITQGARPGTLGPSIIDPAWLDHLVEKYGDIGSADVVHRLTQMGISFNT